MSLTSQLGSFAISCATTAQGRVAFRQACTPAYQGSVTHVLLHGIGSASGSWLAQLLQVGRSAVPAARMLAWDAPGYGDSVHLPMETPSARDYAARVWDWLDASGLDTSEPFTLVGHSLGALMAASAAAQHPARVARLILLAPAQGYGPAEPALRAKKLADRLANLAQLGPAGMAKKRAGAMLSAHAGAELVAVVEHVMAGIDPHGYTQAARMLASADVAADLALFRGPATVASGSADTVTPAESCRTLARRMGVPYIDLGPCGHSCALEAAAAVNRLLGLGGENP